MPACAGTAQARLPLPACLQSRSCSASLTRPTFRAWRCGAAGGGPVWQRGSVQRGSTPVGLAAQRPGCLWWGPRPRRCWASSTWASSWPSWAATCSSSTSTPRVGGRGQLGATRAGPPGRKNALPPAAFVLWCRRHACLQHPPCHGRYALPGTPRPADEKYNFERLQRTTQLNKQPLLVPQPLELSPTEELTVRCSWGGAAWWGSWDGRRWARCCAINCEEGAAPFCPATSPP